MQNNNFSSQTNPIQSRNNNKSRIGSNPRSKNSMNSGPTTTDGYYNM